MSVTNIGTVPNDGTGDTLRAGADKINTAFQNITNNVIPPGTVSNSMIADGAVTASKLATGAIESKLGYTPSPSTHTHADATSTTAGFMSAPYVKKVDRHERMVFDVSANYGGFTFYGDGTNDDQPAIQAAIDAANAAYPSVTEGPRSQVVIPPGYRVKFGSPAILAKPTIFRSFSYVYYHGTSSAAFLIGADTSTVTPDAHYHHDFGIVGVRAMANHNTGTPTGIDGSASSGVIVRQAQFSDFYIGRAIAFKNRGVYLDCTNGLNANWQHVQDCNFRIGELAYCGIGLDLQSADAAKGAAQVNYFTIQNSHSNYRNIGLDQSGRRNSNNNIFNINAMDAPAGPVSAECWGVFNDFTIGYLYGDFRLKTGSYGNAVRALNSPNTGATITDETGNNRTRTAAPDTGTTLPASQSTTAGTYYANSFGVPINIYVGMVLTPGTAEVVGQIYLKRPDGSEYIPVSAIAKPGSTANNVYPATLTVPPGWEYKITFTSTNGSGAINGGAILITEDK